MANYLSLTIVDVALNAYNMARVVTYGGQASGDLFPTRGIVAGDSLGDVLVKLWKEVLDAPAAEEAGEAISPRWAWPSSCGHRRPIAHGLCVQRCCQRGW